MHVFVVSRALHQNGPTQPKIRMLRNSSNEFVLSLTRQLDVMRCFAPRHLKNALRPQHVLVGLDY